MRSPVPAFLLFVAASVLSVAYEGAAEGTAFRYAAAMGVIATLVLGIRSARMANGPWPPGLMVGGLALWGIAALVGNPGLGGTFALGAEFLGGILIFWGLARAVRRRR